MPDPDNQSPHLGRILVADDEPHIRRILTTFLEGSGYQVDEALDGGHAIEILEGDQVFDLALLDIMMPQHTGLEVLDFVRAHPRHGNLPVIILTAKGQDTDREAALTKGADDFLTKPFSPKKLLARIQELIGNR